MSVVHNWVYELYGLIYGHCVPTNVPTLRITGEWDSQLLKLAFERLTCLNTFILK